MLTPSDYIMALAVACWLTAGIIHLKYDLSQERKAQND